MKVCEDVQASRVQRASASAWWRFPFWWGGRIAELDRPLLDVEGELRIVERQHLETAEDPTNATQS